MDPIEYKMIAIAALGVTWGLMKLVFRGIRLHRWTRFLNALRLYNPELHADLGSPKPFLHQVIGEKKPLTNDGVVYQVLKNPELFDSHPQVRRAAELYRTITVYNWIYTGVIVAVAAIILVFWKQ